MTFEGKKIQMIAPQREVKKIRVAAYCRVSTDKSDQLESLQNQVDFYDEYIKEHSDWEFAGIYYDLGISGRKKNRTGLMKMLYEAEQKRIDLILTKSISRFSRNTIDCLEIVRGLSSLGVGVIFERENIDTRTMDGELMMTILTSMAQEEADSTAKNVVWGVHKRFEIGKYKESVAPFGYRLKGYELEVNDEEAEWVEKIFDWYLNGLGTDKIARILNKTCPIKSGWRDCAVSYILQNPKYTGDLHHNKTYTKDGKQIKNKGEQPIYLIEDNHTPIISKESFEKVQTLFEAKRTLAKIYAPASTTGKNEGAKYTRKLKCSCCGKSYIRRKYSEFEYVYWYCRGRYYNNCTRNSIYEVRLDLTMKIIIKKLRVGLKTVLLEYKKGLDSIYQGEADKYKEELEMVSTETLAAIQSINKLKNDGLLEEDFFNKKLDELVMKKQNIEERMLRYSHEKNDQIELRERTQALITFIKRRNEDLKEFIKHIDIMYVMEGDILEVHFKCGIVIKEKVIE